MTVRTYAHDLLRWWRVLSVLDVRWDRSTREDVEAMVGWMRSAVNPQRLRSDNSGSQPGSVNLETGKPALCVDRSAVTVADCVGDIRGAEG